MRHRPRRLRNGPARRPRRHRTDPRPQGRTAGQPHALSVLSPPRSRPHYPPIRPLVPVFPHRDTHCPDTEDPHDPATRLAGPRPVRRVPPRAVRSGR
ncbi:hypothetical protein SBRY_11190 [Actinacidiphila bryophytorum]|uniref:Uncharacterized protein n=1 Tax=Actinacidiphila bryophytorum TaxID=1436133 RepID=A0A9W4GXX3_9ACTN|nr:hypothetical protein SBRY_11190 [Actinacidiphila bryophytorum]